MVKTTMQNGCPHFGDAMHEWVQGFAISNYCHISVVESNSHNFGAYPHIYDINEFNSPHKNYMTAIIESKMATILKSKMATILT